MFDVYQCLYVAEDLVIFEQVWVHPIGDYHGFYLNLKTILAICDEVGQGQYGLDSVWSGGKKWWSGVLFFALKYLYNA